MTEEIIAIIILVGMGLIIINTILLLLSEDSPFDYFYPTVLYKNTNMNIFGCIVCSILLITVNYLYCIPYLICRFVHWLFTVGKRGK